MLTHSPIPTMAASLCHLYAEKLAIPQIGIYKCVYAYAVCLNV